MPLYPGDPIGWQIGSVLFDDYRRANQDPNPGMGVWFFRVAWDIAQGGMETTRAIEKHRAEWLGALGYREAPPFPSPSPSPGGSVTVDGKTFIRKG
jgi:hypothetical protein